MGKGGQEKSCCKGPGYASPLDAFRNGPREKLAYVPAVVADNSRADYLATVDLDPSSSTYSQVIHRLNMPYAKDELHHTGWNACSSCHTDGSRHRSRLILPTINSSRVYAVDTATDPRAPSLAAVAEPEEVAKTGLSWLHSAHCLGSGDIMISTMGDPEGNAKGGFVLLDQDLKVKGKWSDELQKFGYDFWYQPRHNVMISSEFGTPNSFSKGFNPAEVASNYGDTLTIWDYKEKKKAQELKLGGDGLIPLECRFLHNPAEAHAYVGAALSSNIIHITKDADGKWEHKVAVKQEWTQLTNWILPAAPPLITDILISLDDRWLFFSNWLRGDIVQYDLSDPANPKFAARIFVGGVARKGDEHQVTGGLPEDISDSELPEVPTVQGHHLHGGPQMLQLSLDGKRLYVTNSLLAAWDQQFYPEMCKHGSYMLQIDVDNQQGGLSINHDFYVDFGAEPGGPVLAHEVRYPGGDCSSDIWL